MTPSPRPAPARPARPALKLYSTVAELGPGLARAFDGACGLQAAVYVVAVNRVAAMDALTRIDSIYRFHAGRDVEAHPLGGGPEIAQAIARDHRAAMVEGAVFAVHGTTVLAVDEQGAPSRAGRYAHDRKRYLPISAAERLAEVIDTAERMLTGNLPLSGAEATALREVLDAAMERQMQLREAERHAAAVRDGAAYPACLADSDR